jgi:hypothetical protein
MASKTIEKTFKFNNNESTTKMYDNLNSYVIGIKKQKYDNILKLLNKLFDKNNESLRFFKNINIQHFRYENYDIICDIFVEYEKILNYDLKELKKSNTIISLNNEIFNIILKLLKLIDYKLQKITYNGKKYYNICMK